MTQFVIDLKSQISEVATYGWMLDDEFFAAVQGPEIQHGNVNASLSVQRNVAGYELSFTFRGELTLLCDRCLEPMRYPVEGENVLKVQLGETAVDDGERIIVQEDDGTIDVSWYLYEMIALQIPLRHVHADGECTGETGDALKKYMPGEDSEEEKPTDPRWDALKGILNNN